MAIVETPNQPNRGGTNLTANKSNNNTNRRGDLKSTKLRNVQAALKLIQLTVQNSACLLCLCVCVYTYVFVCTDVCFFVESSVTLLFSLPKFRTSA